MRRTYGNAEADDGSAGVCSRFGWDLESLRSRLPAREVASRGITCNAVAPGFVVTELTRDLPASQTDQIKTQTPLGRFGTVDEIASAVTFLASDEAGYITGQVLAVEGGLVMQ